MIKQYRKKPVLVDAVQWDCTEATYHELIKFAPNNVPYWDKLGSENRLFISTLEGRMMARNGDYIIKGVKGEVYPCKPDIFEATYEEVTSPEHFKACPYSWDGLICEVSSRFAQERDIAQADSATLRQYLAEAQELIKVLEAHKNRLLSAINSTSISCPGNGWNYDWVDDEKGCFPVPDEYIGRVEQCRACWEAALGADNVG